MPPAASAATSTDREPIQIVARASAPSATFTTKTLVDDAMNTEAPVKRALVEMAAMRLCDLLAFAQARAAV